MPGPQKQAPVIIVVLALLAVLPMGCRKQLSSVDGPTTPEPAGEPEHYSATVVRTVDDRDRTEVKVARSGDLRSSQWIQDGETRVSIWRSDLGRVFLLSLERQVYVESDFDEDRHTPDAPLLHIPRGTGSSTSGGGSSTIYPESIDRALGDESSPEHVETEELQGEVVDGHSCRAIRKRATFPDGHVETTLMFCARDLDGLAIRMESETEGVTGRIKIVTEWRDIRTDPAPDRFAIPTGFKRVNSL